MTKIRCCVLIPYYNSGVDLINTISSIEASEGCIADVVVIDDGSEETSASEILSSYDGLITIQLYRLESNLGIEHALNFGLSRVRHRYEYIARLDCGDYCLNGRLAKQMRELDEDQSCFLIGSYVDFIDENGEYLYTLTHPTESLSIRRGMKINCSLTHPSVMFRSSLLDIIGYYPTEYPAAEDYAFFLKAITSGVEVRNIPEVLTRCVISSRGISSVRRKTQIKSRIKLMVRYYELSWLATYGIVRSTLLFFTPRELTVALKKIARNCA